MKLVCQQNRIPEVTATRGLGLFKREIIVKEKQILPLTVGKEYNICFYTHTTGYNYVNTNFRITIFTDNNQWEHFDFEDSEGLQMLKTLFKDPV